MRICFGIKRFSEEKINKSFVTIYDFWRPTLYDNKVINCIPFYQKVLQDGKEVALKVKKPSVKNMLVKSVKSACDLELIRRPEFQTLMLSR